MPIFSELSLALFLFLYPSIPKIIPTNDFFCLRCLLFRVLALNILGIAKCIYYIWSIIQVS